MISESSVCSFWGVNKPPSKREQERQRGWKTCLWETHLWALSVNRRVMHSEHTQWQKPDWLKARAHLLLHNAIRYNAELQVKARINIALYEKAGFTLSCFWVLTIHAAALSFLVPSYFALFANKTQNEWIVWDQQPNTRVCVIGDSGWYLPSSSKQISFVWWGRVALKLFVLMMKQQTVKKEKMRSKEWERGSARAQPTFPAGSLPCCSDISAAECNWPRTSPQHPADSLKDFSLKGLLSLLPSTRC